MWLRISRRQLPIQRSAIPFCQGAFCLTDGCYTFRFTKPEFQPLKDDAVFCGVLTYSAPCPRNLYAPEHSMIIRGNTPAISIPEVSITDYALRHADRLGDKPALIDGPTGRMLKYAKLAEAIKRAATGLAHRGFRRGDVLAIYSPNLPEYAIVFNAVASLGGINTPINALYTVEELTTQLNDSKARYLVTVEAFLDKAKAAAAKSGVEEIYVFDSAARSRHFSELLEYPPDPPFVAINPRRDLVVLPYSSGTTGLPKGVMLTHYNLVANLCQCEGMQGFDGFGENDVVMAVLPFSHIYGMVVIMKYGLARGGTTITMPFFELQEFLSLMQRYQVTIAPVVPPLVTLMAKHPAVSQVDLSSLRMVISGAAPLSEEAAEGLSRRLGCPVTQGYGMTEASPVTHLTPTRNSPFKPGSIGKVVPNTEVKIVDVTTGAELGPGQKGELLVRGPQVMSGYLNHPEATAVTLDAEGWCRTGDIGYVDDEQWFFVVDRTKELIKFKGLPVAPAELEAVLLTHSAVMDAAVIRKLDEEAGEVPKAYVVLRTGEASLNTTPDDLMTWVAKRVAPHKKIRYITFTDSIPRSASGKILRRVLIEKEEQQELQGR
jgi:acyl-CoA synthetase (AMP-forming)/AMP-acid ligase II